MSVAPPPATYTATNDLNALKNIFVPQYQFSNGYYHAIVNTQLPGNVAVGNTTTGFLLTVNGAPTMTLSDLQNWSYYVARSNVVLNSNSITTVSKLTFVGGNTTNAFTIDAPNGFINVSAYYLRGNFINLSGGLTAWARYPATTNVNVSGYSVIGAASVSLSLGGTITNPASNVIGFSNAAFGETMRITQSGQLSVGTTAQFPGFSLVVNGSSQFKSTIVMTTSGYTSSSNSFFVNGLPTTVGNVDIQMGALGGNTNLVFCTGGTLTQRLKLESNGNFTVMTGTLTTTDPTLPHSVGGIIFQNQNISATSLTINGVPYTGGVASGVASLNSLSGAITLTAGTNISLYTSGNSIVIGVSGSTGGGSSGGVTTLNSLSGAITLSAGTNISLYTSGNTIVIGVSGSTGGGSSGGVTSLNTLSGVLTLSAGTNISLFTSGSNIIVRSTISGTYGGVILSGGVVTADSIDTDSAILSSIGGVKFQLNQLSASALFIPGSQQSLISGIKLSNCVITLSSIEVSEIVDTASISITGGIDICGGFLDSIVGTVNGLAGQVTVSGGTGIGVATVLGVGGTVISIATAPIPITLLSPPVVIIQLPTTGRGDIFLFPTTYSDSGIPISLAFPPDPAIVPVGTSWRITNSSPCNANFIYTTGFATLPNLDPDAFGIFTLSAFYSILLVKATSNFGGTIYYNVDI
jgi:hypothetical protein